MFDLKLFEWCPAFGAAKQSLHVFFSFLAFVLLAFLVVFGVGCRSVNQECISRPFAGLRASMEPQTAVCVLFVHGIGGYSAGDPDNLIAAIKCELKLQTTPDGKPQNIYPTTDADPATLYREVAADNNGNELRLYTLAWEPITKAIKKQYLGYDTDSPIAKTRQSLDREARQAVMYERVGDVAVYAGVGKQAIQGSVKNALRIMHHNVEAGSDAKKKYRYFIVTWSLGSKIVFDCLHKPAAATQPAESANEDALTKIARHTDSVFMLANQLPLLAILDPKPGTNPVEAKATAAGIEGFVKHRNAARAAAALPTKRLSVVAVSDPNDLLSYPIPDWLEQQVPDVDFSNVSVSVATVAGYIPIIAPGWTINPIKAHTGYGSDDRVIHMVIDGSPAK